MNALQRLRYFTDQLHNRIERWAFRDWPFHYDYDDYEIVQTPANQYPLLLDLPGQAKPINHAQPLRKDKASGL